MEIRDDFGIHTTTIAFRGNGSISSTICLGVAASNLNLQILITAATRLARLLLLAGVDR